MPVPAEIERRVVAFQQALREADVDCAVIVEASDLVYLTGVMADAHLVVPADDDPVLLVRRDVERAQADSPLEDVRPLRSLRDLQPLLAELGARRVGFELDVLPAARYLRYRDLLDGIEIVDVADVVAGLRAVKSTWEIDMAMRAARQLAAAFAAAPALVAEQPTDLAVQIELERVLRLHGHQGPMRFRGLNGQMFYGAVLGGPDGAVAPWSDTPLGGPGVNNAVARGPGGWELRDGDAVTVDLVGAHEGYLADATRTFFRGEPHPLLAEALAVCEAILIEIETLLRPGTPAEEAYRRGLEIATAAGFGEHWMGHGPGRVRFVGHGVGLDINERPFLAEGFAQPLAFGNVVAVEPKLVFPGLGAVGVENTYAIDRDGPLRLT
jgi:Xaa-Pro aminopeptidase